MFFTYSSILSQIGKRISEPHNLNINVIMDKGSELASIRNKVNYMAEGMLDNIGEFTLDISLGKYKTF